MITVHSISLELQYRYARENVTAKIENGEMKYLHNSKWIDKDAYDILYPVAVYQPLSKAWTENPCKKNEFVNNRKSY
jgi:hypothetical protein